MTKKELLTAYRAATIELEELRRQLKRVGSDGRPAGVRTMQTDRIARGTNDPDAAAMQLADGLEALLAQREAELTTLSAQVDALLAGIRDFRTYLVIHHYYRPGGRGPSHAAEATSCASSTVNPPKIREN